MEGRSGLRFQTDFFFSARYICLPNNSSSRFKIIIMLKSLHCGFASASGIKILQTIKYYEVGNQDEGHNFSPFH